MIVIVGHVTTGSEEATIVAAGKAIEKDLEDLLGYVMQLNPQQTVADTITGLFSTLHTIISDLNEIRSQNRILMVIFSNINKAKVDGCVDRLTVALEKFHVCPKFYIWDATYLCIGRK